MSTALTLLTGLNENGVLAYLTGQFASIRSRLKHNRINYKIVPQDQYGDGTLPDLVDVGTNYVFRRAPTRTPRNLGDNRSVCMRVNSVSAPSLALYFDDFYGHGARREQVFLYSISAAHCQVVNFDPQWIASHCIEGMFQGNSTACYAYMLTEFDQLKLNQSVQVGAVSDFGVAGAPFLKCAGRPQQSFQYLTDHLVLQSFWAGQDYHVEIQTSQCWAKPALAPSGTDRYGLFRVQSADQQASVVVGVPPLQGLIQGIPIIYAVTTLVMIVRGVLAILKKRQEVTYTPSAIQKHLSWGDTIHLISFGKTRRLADSLRFFSTNGLVASNLWMNHWVYITVSVVDSVVNTRAMYVVLEIGSWMLSKQVSLENFFFICSALTKLTWLTCVAHTLLRHVLQAAIHAGDVVLSMWQPGGSGMCAFLRWYVDAIALLVNFKIYSVLLALQLYCVVRITGSATVMKHDAYYKQPVYGGFADLAPMQGSEIACDLLVICSIQIAMAHVIGSLLLLTKLRLATHNRMLRILQQRYVFIGWDAYVAMHALGIDPFHPATVSSDGRSTGDDVGGAGVLATVTTDCTIAALTQQMQASGPTVWASFAGDSALVKSKSPVDSCSSPSQSTGLLRYPLLVAELMGLCVAPSAPLPLPSLQHSRRSISEPRPIFIQQGLSRMVHPQEVPTTTVWKKDEPPSGGSSSRMPFHERVLHVHAESRWGALVLVDELHEPGRIISGVDDEQCGMDELVVDEFIVRDALHLLNAEELIKLGRGQMTLRIC